MTRTGHGSNSSKGRRLETRVSRTGRGLSSKIYEKVFFFFLFLWPYTSFNFNVTGNSIVCIDRGTEYFLWEPCRLKVNFTFYFFSSLNSTFPRCRGRVVFSARTFFFLLLLFFFFIGTRARATTPAQA